MEDRKVKGTMLQDYVRFIRSNKDKDWNKYLEPVDWEIIEGRIMPSVWYPFETWQRIGLAVFELVAGGNMEAARIWGRASTEQVIKDLYKSAMSDPDPAKVIQRFVNISGQWFNFTAMEFEKIDDNHVRIHVGTDPDEKGMEAYLMQVRGGMEYIVEAKGGKNPKIQLSTEKTADKTGVSIEVSWE